MTKRIEKIKGRIEEYLSFLRTGPAACAHAAKDQIDLYACADLKFLIKEIEKKNKDIIALTSQLETSQDLLSILRLQVESMDSDRTFEDFGKGIERLLSSDDVYEHLHWDNVRTLEAVTGKPYEPGYFKDKFTENGG